MAFRDDFIESAIAHGESTEAGDNLGANAAYDRIIKALAAIRHSGDHGVGELRKLLVYPDSSVRGWGATYLLPLDETPAVLALTEIASGPGIVSYSAGIALREWQAGKLELPNWP